MRDFTSRLKFDPTILSIIQYYYSHCLSLVLSSWKLSLVIVILITILHVCRLYYLLSLQSLVQCCLVSFWILIISSLVLILRPTLLESTGRLQLAQQNIILYYKVIFFIVIVYLDNNSITATFFYPKSLGSFILSKTINTFNYSL